MGNIKLIAFDVDGTLVPLGGKKIEDSTAKAVRAFEEKGGKVIIATGRCSYFIHKEIVEEMNCDYYVTINGGLVCDKDFKTLYQRPMDEEFFHKLVKSGIEHDLAFAFKFEKAIAVYKSVITVPCRHFNAKRRDVSAVDSCSFMVYSAGCRQVDIPTIQNV